jgi:hypothetical protein
MYHFTVCSSSVIPVSVVSTLGESRLSDCAIIPSDGSDCTVFSVTVLYLAGLYCV